MELSKFWAKSSNGNPDGEFALSILDHSLHTGYVAQASLQYIPKVIKKNLIPPILLEKNYLILFAALHDIGKISPFQLKLDDWRNEHFPHLNFSYQEYQGYHTEYTYQFFERETNFGEEIACWTASHHGKDVTNALNLDEDEDFPFLNGRRSLYERCAQEFGIDTKQICAHLKSLDLDSLPNKKHLARFIIGWISILDWIASDVRFFPCKKNSLSSSQMADKARLALSSLYNIVEKKIISGLSFSELFNDDIHLKWTRSPFQELAKKIINEPGIYILEAPMGEGKTEAALEATYTLLQKGDNQGLYFALPTRLTSNHMHQRIDQFIKKLYASEVIPVHLVHKNAFLRNRPLNCTLQEIETETEKSENNPFSWFLPKKRALLFPYGVGTIDQLLLAVLKTRHYAVRYFGVAGKVIILDEIHSYDIYTSELIQNLIEKLRKLQCTILILSATLTEKAKQKLLNNKKENCISYKVFDSPFYKDKSKEILISFISFPPKLDSKNSLESEKNLWKEIIRKCLEKVEQGYQILWIVNTVQKAQKIFDLVESQKREDQATGLLHSRFPHWRREELENEYLPFFAKNRQARQGFLLISTQIVEQSLDIDSDLLITELAPTDHILQRMGRLWRHSTQKRPSKAKCEAWIYSLDIDLLENSAEDDNPAQSHFQGTQYIYEPYLLYRTWKIWQARYQISRENKSTPLLKLPLDMSLLLEETYSFPVCKTRLEEKFKEKYDAIQKKQLDKARSACNKTSLDYDIQNNQDYNTRWNGVPQVNLLLVKEEEGIKKGKRISFLSNESLILTSRRYCHNAHTLIVKNLVSLPKSIVQEIKARPESYFGEIFYIAKVDEVNQIFIGNSNTSLVWSHKKGIESNMRSINESDE